MQHMRPSLQFTLLLTLFCANPSFAAETLNSSVQQVTLNPSADIWGFVGQRGIAKAQGRLPFGGNGLESTFFGFIEGAGSYDKKAGYAAGLGAGYRKIFNNAYILGAYFIPDFNRSPYGHNFWTLNPGVEALTPVWDFRVNGYFPINGKTWHDDEVWADAIGKNYVKFQGHQQLNHIFATREETSVGIDGEIGRNIPIKPLTKLKLFVGGYYFGMDKTDRISGVTGRLFYPLTKHTAFEIRESYDNVRKNTLQVGLRINIGGFDNNAKDTLGIVSRLTDPVEHNFANFASGNTVPINTQFMDKGSRVQKSNLWFVKSTTANAVAGDGTYEHPYSGIDPAVMNHIATNPEGINAALYFAPGTYSLDGFPGSRMTLKPGFSIWGRSTDFTQPAYLGGVNSQPVLMGGVDLTAGNNALDSVNIRNNGTQDLGVWINSAGNKMSHVNIGTDDATAGVYQTGILVDSGGVLDLVQNNQIYGFTAENDFACGAEAYINGVLNIGNDNAIKASTTAADAWVYGLSVGYSKVLVYGNNNFFGGSAVGSAGKARAFGAVMADSEVTINGDNNAFIGTANGGAGYGIQMQNFNSGTTTLNINGNNNAVIGTSGLTSTENQAFGIWFNDATVNIKGSNNAVIAAAAHADAVGIFAHSDATLTISGNNNAIIATSANGNAYGISANNALLTFSGKNNNINVNAGSAKVAYGMRLIGANTAVNISGVHFNIGQNTNGASNLAYGIYAAGIDQRNLSIKNNTFVVSATTPNNAYGIYGFEVNWDNAFKDKLRAENTFKGNIPDAEHQVFPR